MNALVLIVFILMIICSVYFRYCFHLRFFFLIGNQPASYFPANGTPSINSSTPSLLNGSIPPNGLYIPPPPGNIFWPLGLRSKPRRGMLRRAVFSDQQRKGLEVAFLKQKYISKPERKKLAQRLGLKDSQVNKCLFFTKNNVYFLSFLFNLCSFKVKIW